MKDITKPSDEESCQFIFTSSNVMSDILKLHNLAQGNIYRQKT